MQIGYTCLGKRLSRASKHVAVALGLVALPVSMKLEKVAASTPIAKPVLKPVRAELLPAFAPDPRTDRLRRFFSRLHCPVVDLAEDFVHAADDNHLDWRLLPSISVIESGGGKAYKNNNIFGWANGDHLFPTVRSSINEVAFKLGKSSLYRNRDVEGKLRLYNSEVDDYAGNVVSVMNQISPVVNLRPARRVQAHASRFAYATD